MRVGVVIGGLLPTEGGGFTFRASIVSGIKQVRYRHDFVFLDEQEAAGEAASATHTTLLGSICQSVASHSLVKRVTRRIRRSLMPPEPPSSQLAQRIDALGVDIVWFLSPINDPPHVPYIATVWDLQHRLQPFFPEVSVSGWTWDDRERNYRALLPRAARVITGTQVGKNDLARFYGVALDNVFVIPLPAPEFAEEENGELGACVRQKYAIDRPFIFYPAQFWPHKNHINLLLALQLLTQGGLDLDIVLTGSDKGNGIYVAEMAQKLGLSSRVHNLGFVTSGELEALYREALALVFPSVFGPDNIPPLEAFALSCPVAAARVAGSEEQLENAALLFDPTDPADIARAIKALHDDPQLRKQLVGAGRALVAHRRTADYLEKICVMLDEFEPFRRSWGRNYSVIA